MPKIFIIIFCFFSAFIKAQEVAVKLLPKTINTEESEFNFLQTNETTGYYSSSILEKGKYRTFIYTTKYKDSKWNKPTYIDFGNYYAVANISCFLNDRYIYFSACDDLIKCKIAKKDIVEDKIQFLDNRINLSNSNNTQPHITQHNNQKVIYFVSDRKGGFGGLDIWFSIISEDGYYGMPINAGEAINTAFDEITPFYNPYEKSLYFSSNRKKGKGGFDIYKSVGSTNLWKGVESVPFLSSQYDDMYLTFFTPKKGYFSSNRRDTACCNDIYTFEYQNNHLDKIKKKRFKKYLPLSLFFDNDDPSMSAEGNSYKDSYITYFQKEDKYVKVAQDSMVNRFFSDSLQSNFNILVLMLDQMLIDLSKGKKIEIHVKGYASPLYEAEYNIKLSQRRIKSVINFIKTYKGKIFESYFSSNQFIISVTSFGESKSSSKTSDSPNDTKRSIYSIDAMKERKVEIIEVLYQ